MKVQEPPTARRLKTREAADYTGLSPSTLAKMRVYGGGPVFIKVESAVLYDTDDLDEWLRAHRRRSTSDRDGCTEMG